MFLTGLAHAADDPVQKAMKAYEKHRYEEAARDLRASLPSLDQGKQSQAQLALGMIYLKNAELHRELAQASASANADYLRRLAAERGGSRSRYSDLFLGLALIEAGKPDAATAPLEKFIAGGNDAKFTSIASIALGMAANLAGDKQKAREAWEGIATGDPEVRTELAAAWSRAGVAEKDAPSLCDQALADGRKGGKASSIIAVKNCLGVYARAGQAEKGRDLLHGADLKAYSYRESLGKSKVLSFYDIQLLDSLAAYYLRESLAALEKAASDQGLRNIANYYLGEAHALAGNADQSLKATAVFLGAPQAPPQYKNRALVHQGALQYQKGRQADAIGTWDDLTRTQPGDPDLLADILLACGRLRIECPRTAQAAAAAVEQGEGKRFNITNIGLGRYYFGRRDYTRALTYLEAGRDKGNKNKIEFNDPLMLVDLAETYYRSKKYSEALEIYFEMSKQFPQVRQVQEALQGVYSMEHKSAGDVKIN
jgi:tetratricopeptide (TPR) repeat protein